MTLPSPFPFNRTRSHWSRTVGNLLVLPTRKAPARAVEAGRSADILFFTGVRYYRMEEAAPVPTDAKRRSPRARKPAAEPLTELQA